MGSKIFLLLGLSIAFVLLVSSEVAARDLAETTKKTEGYGGGNYNNGGGYHNGGGNYNNGGGYHNGGGNYNNGGGYHNGGGGYHNGGGNYNNGGGYHNGGGGYHNGGGGYHNGGGCYHGYCQYKHRCCNSAAEALENTQVKPQN